MTRSTRRTFHCLEPGSWLAIWLMALCMMGSPGQPAASAQQEAVDSLGINLQDASLWHVTGMAYEKHTDSSAIDTSRGTLRFIVMPQPGKASHVWHSAKLQHPIAFKGQHPFLVVRYRAMNIDTTSKYSAIGLRETPDTSDYIRFEPVKSRQIVADGQEQTIRVDLRTVSAGGKRTGVAHQIAVAVRGNGQGPAYLELLELRFESAGPGGAGGAGGSEVGRSGLGGQAGVDQGG